MKILILDHFFQHDISAMRRAAHSHEIRVVDAERFRRIATRFLAPEVFAHGLGERFASPEYAAARVRYERAAAVELRRLYANFPFDAVVVPSDTISYLRALGPAAHSLGAPFIVLQKETTISPFTMTNDSAVIAQYLPFSGDIMFVCSEHHKQFWINAGANPEDIVVTGQPRFDFYFDEEHWGNLEDLGITLDEERPLIVFFSYDLGAYSPDGPLARVWGQLRRETETALISLALDGLYNVVIKPHPQQQEQETHVEELKQIAGRAWGRSVCWLSGAADARQLIVNATTVVGFQTTALFEALAAGKRVVYTCWTEPTERLRGALVPFEAMDGALEVARGPEHLRSLLQASGRDRDAAIERSGRREVEKQMGRLDGLAAERAWRGIEGAVTAHAATVCVAERAARIKLDTVAPAMCRRHLRRACRLDAVYALAEISIATAVRAAAVLERALPGGIARRLSGLRSEVQHQRTALTGDAAYSARFLRERFRTAKAR